MGTMVVDRLKEYGIEPVVTDGWADAAVAKREYGIELAPLEQVPKADFIIVAIRHNEFQSMSMSQLKMLFKDKLPDEEKAFVDVQSPYRMDELDSSEMRFRRL